MNNNEQWREHPSHEGYHVSTLGRVRGPRGKILKPSGAGSSRAYRKVGCHMRTQLVHRLVAETWLPNPEGKPQVNHRNCDPADNRVANLEWATCRENFEHGVRWGRYGKHLRVLTAGQVALAEWGYRILGVPQRRIADLLGVSPSSLCRRLQRIR